MRIKLKSDCGRGGLTEKQLIVWTEKELFKLLPWLELTMVNWEIHVEMNKGKSLFRPLIDKIRLAEIRTCYYQNRNLTTRLDLTFTNMPPSQKPRPFVVMFILWTSQLLGLNVKWVKATYFFFTPNTWIGKVITSVPFCGPFPNFAAILIFFFPPCLSLFSPFLLFTHLFLNFFCR